MLQRLSFPAALKISTQKRQARHPQNKTKKKTHTTQGLRETKSKDDFLLFLKSPHGNLKTHDQTTTCMSKDIYAILK